MDDLTKDDGLKKSSPPKRSFSVPIAHKLILSFLLVSIVSTAIFTFAGITLMANRIVAEAQDRIRNDLNAAREIYTRKKDLFTRKNNPIISPDRSLGIPYIPR